MGWHRRRAHGLDCCRREPAVDWRRPPVGAVGGCQRCFALLQRVLPGRRRRRRPFGFWFEVSLGFGRGAWAQYNETLVRERKISFTIVGLDNLRVYGSNNDKSGLCEDFTELEGT